MTRFARITLTASALSLAVLLAGCENFDPTAIFDAEIFNTKKKLQGERKPVFPEGTPGVSRGVPPELVKGYNPPAQSAAGGGWPSPPPAPGGAAQPSGGPAWPDPPPSSR